MSVRFLPIALLSLGAIASTTLAQTDSHPYVVNASGVGYRSLADAVGAIGDGTGTISIAPGTYHQCAVQQSGNISYRARQAGSVIFDGTTCEGKAALVLRGRTASVDGIIFQNLRVADGNGAGIRLERGNLDVTHAMFRDSEEGILTHDDPASSIRIDQSTFAHLGRCDRDLSCAHSIYVGDYGSLSVTRSVFKQGTGGHYVKTRSAQVNIVDNSFDDSAGHLTNYMVDLSNGSSGLIANNEMEQGRDKDNYSAFITVAPEGRNHDSSNLIVRGNTARFVPGLDRASTFVANWTADRVTIIGNQIAPGIKLTDRR
ncbi:MAG: right-handed parallel beta-helix repeat-containing protein [Sphingobium sp.]